MRGTQLLSKHAVTEAILHRIQNLHLELGTTAKRNYSDNARELQHESIKKAYNLKTPPLLQRLFIPPPKKALLNDTFEQYSTPSGLHWNTCNSRRSSCHAPLKTQ